MSELLDDGLAPVKNSWFSDKKTVRSYLGLSHNGLEILGLFVILLLMIVYNILSIKQFWLGGWLGQMHLNF